MSDGEKDKDNSQGNQAQQEDDLYIRNLFDDNSFQALVQTIRNEDQNATPTQFNMPTDLQRYFANDSEDVLPIADYNDAFPPGQEPSDFISMLKTGQQDLSVTNINHDGNRGNSNNSNSNIGTSHATQQQQFNNQQQNQLFGIPNQVSFFDDLPVGTSLQQQQQQQPQSLPSNHQTTPSPQKIVTPTQSSSSSGTMTLLDSITAQLPLERKNKFSLLFVELQKHTITPENFLTQAKYLLDERGYRMLENLLENLKEQTPTTTDVAQGSNTSTSIDVSSSTSSTVTTSTQVSSSADNDQRKRTISSSQVRHEDSQRSMVGLMTPQSKRSKTEHVPGMQRGSTKAANTHMNIATPPPLPTSSSEPPSLPTSSNIQNIATPEFKQPDAPANQGLQVPRSSSFSSIATPMSSIAPTTHPTPGATSSAAPSSGGGGDNRIDYDAITDVMGYAGVDLKEEVEHFMKDGGDTIGGIPVDGVDRSKSQDFMNGRLLQQLVTKLAKPLAINHVDPDVVAYLSLATQDRLRGLVEDMVKASKHRIERRSPFQRAPPTATSSSKVEYPLYKILVKADPKQALMALEQLDRQNTSPSQQQNSSKLPLSLRNQGDKRWKLTSQSYGSAIRSFSVKDANDNMDQDKNVTVMDAIFALEREGQGGKGSGQKTLLKMYNQWLQ